jgi:transcriptional regulator with PAS, ATPase and Fis domain
LILGETGSGKEVVAKALWESGIRTRGGRLVRLDCSGVPESLQESTLFGTVKSAFTNAGDIPGFIEEAQNGTLFLDELGEMPPTLQVKLLTFLETGQFHRVGSTKVQVANVRILAATNRPLATMIDKGEFRADLFFRLRGVSIEVPPLRKRMEDIPLLVDHFLAGESALRKRPVPSMTPQAERVLMSHRWPGNVRELKRVVESAVAQALFEDVMIDSRHIRAAISDPALEPAAMTDDLPERLEDAVNQVERAVLERALRRYKNDTRMAALDMGVTRQTVYNLKRKHGIGTEG